MYRCYACGKQIADDNDQCPFCKFPVISTLHGDHVEEEEILKFAEEYRRTNPEYFHEVNKVIPEEPAKIKPESTIAGPEKAGTAEANGQISEKDDTLENGLKSDKTAVPLKKKSKKGGF